MSERLTQRLLLLGWDGADWQIIQPLLDAGRMPFLEQLLNAGIMGDLATLRPILSPMLWSSIATGKRADQHGIFGFIEPRPDGSGVRPVTSTSLKAAPLWNILEANGIKSACVNWFASQPAGGLSGTVVSNQFAQPTGKDFDTWRVARGSVSPRSLVEQLREVRVHPSDIGPEQLATFIPRIGELNAPEDKVARNLAKLLANTATVHGAGTWLAEHGDWDLLAVYYGAIDLCCHAAMEYRPPRMSMVTEEDVELYGGIVDEMYCFHDLMLGRYMNLVGPETTIMIISDHGFLNDHLRPNVSADTQDGAPVQWHREQGVLTLAGPGVKQDELIFGAGLLDIAPTILSLFGLPVGKDMDGRVLLQCFQKPPQVEYIDSYEDIAAIAAGAQDQDEAEDVWAAQETIRQLVDLGYIDEPDEDGAKAVEKAVIMKLRNFAESELSAHRYESAGDLFVQVLERCPDDRFLRLQLARCRLRLGDHEGCRELLEATFVKNPNSPRAHLMQGEIFAAKGEHDEALKHFQQVEKQQHDLPNVRFLMGRSYLHQQRWEDAERVFRQALDHDDNAARIHHGLGAALSGQEHYEEAIESLLRAIALRFDRAGAHYDLAMALSATGRLEAAIAAGLNMLKVRPRMPQAHALLAKLYKAAGDEGAAVLHSSKARLRREELREVPPVPTNVTGG